MLQIEIVSNFLKKRQETILSTEITTYPRSRNDKDNRCREEEKESLEPIEGILN